MVLKDDCFKVPSSQATEALEAASTLLDWCKEDTNKKQFIVFSKWLVVSLNNCFAVSDRKFSAQTEKMWEKYHELRVSDSFTGEWDKLFQDSLGKQAMPTLFQYVPRQVFKELLANDHAVCDAHNDIQPSPLTWEEENALRYVGGFVCRKVRQKITESSLPHKEDMLLLTIALCGDEADEDRGTETWMNEIDRGGLWHISDDTYSVFLILEYQIRCHLQVTALKKLDETTKITIIDATLANEDLLFQWALVSANAHDFIGTAVLKKIVTLYITIRGFAFATSCLEIYKQRHRKNVQKSKALRREVKDPETN